MALATARKDAAPFGKRPTWNDEYPKHVLVVGAAIGFPEDFTLVLVPETSAEAVKNGRLLEIGRSTTAPRKLAFSIQHHAPVPSEARLRWKLFPTDTVSRKQPTASDITTHTVMDDVAAATRSMYLDGSITLQNTYMPNASLVVEQREWNELVAAALFPLIRLGIRQQLNVVIFNDVNYKTTFGLTTNRLMTENQLQEFVNYLILYLGFPNRKITRLNFRASPYVMWVLHTSECGDSEPAVNDRYGRFILEENRYTLANADQFGSHVLIWLAKTVGKPVACRQRTLIDPLERLTTSLARLIQGATTVADPPNPEFRYCEWYQSGAHACVDVYVQNINGTRQKIPRVCYVDMHVKDRILYLSQPGYSWLYDAEMFATTDQFRLCDMFASFLYASIFARVRILNQGPRASNAIVAIRQEFRWPSTTPTIPGNILAYSIDFSTESALDHEEKRADVASLHPGTTKMATDLGPSYVTSKFVDARFADALRQWRCCVQHVNRNEDWLSRPMQYFIDQQKSNILETVAIVIKLRMYAPVQGWVLVPEFQAGGTDAIRAKNIPVNAYVSGSLGAVTVTTDVSPDVGRLLSVPDAPVRAHVVGTDTSVRDTMVAAAAHCIVAPAASGGCASFSECNNDADLSVRIGCAANTIANIGNPLLVRTGVTARVRTLSSTATAAITAADAPPNPLERSGAIVGLGNPLRKLARVRLSDADFGPPDLSRCARLPREALGLDTPGNKTALLERGLCDLFTQNGPDYVATYRTLRAAYPGVLGDTPPELVAAMEQVQIESAAPPQLHPPRQPSPEPPASLPPSQPEMEVVVMPRQSPRIIHTQSDYAMQRMLLRSRGGGAWAANIIGSVVDRVWPSPWLPHHIAALLQTTHTNPEGRPGSLHVGDRLVRVITQRTTRDVDETRLHHGPSICHRYIAEEIGIVCFVQNTASVTEDTHTPEGRAWLLANVVVIVRVGNAYSLRLLGDIFNDDVARIRNSQSRTGNNSYESLFTRGTQIVAADIEAAGRSQSESPALLPTMEPSPVQPSSIESPPTVTALRSRRYRSRSREASQSGEIRRPQDRRVPAAARAPRQQIVQAPVVFELHLHHGARNMQRTLQCPLRYTTVTGGVACLAINTRVAKEDPRRYGIPDRRNFAMSPTEVSLGKKDYVVQGSAPVANFRPLSNYSQKSRGNVLLTWSDWALPQPLVREDSPQMEQFWTTDVVWHRMLEALERLDRSLLWLRILGGQIYISGNTLPMTQLEMTTYMEMAQAPAVVRPLAAEDDVDEVEDPVTEADVSVALQQQVEEVLREDEVQASLMDDALVTQLLQEDDE